MLPSYDIESRRDAYDESELRVVQVVTLRKLVSPRFTIAMTIPYCLWMYRTFDARHEIEPSWLI